jgi:hypothetical protein
LYFDALNEHELHLASPDADYDAPLPVATAITIAVEQPVLLVPKPPAPLPRTNGSDITYESPRRIALGLLPPNPNPTRCESYCEIIADNCVQFVAKAGVTVFVVYCFVKIFALDDARPR